MGIFGTLFKGAVDTILLPVAVVKDVLDMSAGEEATNTAEKLNDIKEDLDELTD